MLSNEKRRGHIHPKTLFSSLTLPLPRRRILLSKIPAIYTNFLRFYLGLWKNSRPHPFSSASLALATILPPWNPSVFSTFNTCACQSLNPAPFRDLTDWALAPDFYRISLASLPYPLSTPSRTVPAAISGRPTQQKGWENGSLVMQVSLSAKSVLRPLRPLCSAGHLRFCWFIKWEGGKVRIIFKICS